MTKILPALLIGLIVTLPAIAEEPLVIDLREAVDAAVEGNTDMRKQRIDLEAARRAYNYRAATFLPSLDVAASLASTPPASFTPQAGLSADLTFSLRASDFSGLRKAPLDLQTAETGYANLAASTIRSVKKAFYALLILEERETLLEENIDSMKARYEAARYDWETGRIAEYEVLSARLSYLTLLPELEDFRIQAAASRETFLRLLNLPPETAFTLDGSLDVEVSVPNRDTLRAAVEEHGTLKLLELRRQQREEALRVLYDRYYPVLNIGASLDIPPGSLSLSPAAGGKYYSLSVSIDLADFLPFSPMAESVTAAREALETIDLDIASAARNLRTTTGALLDKIGKAERDIEVYRFNLELAEEYYNIVKTEYEEGRQDIMSLEDADLKLQRARVDLLTKKAAYIDLVIDLEYYTGREIIR